MSKEKVVLAYSGGLDTSVILKWLENTYQYEVIAVCIDVGQGDDYSSVEEKALKTGAVKAYVIDAKEEFVSDYIFPTLKAGATYEDDYLLGTSFARPLIAQKLVEIAEKEGAVAISHGATGKGNDQVRFEATIKALNPNLKIIAPWRIWDLKSREDCIDYATQNNIPITVTKKNIYSRDQNVWHLSHEGGNLEDPWNEHDSEIYQLTVPPEKAPDSPTYVEVEFLNGVPVAVDGEKLSPLAIVETLNKVAGANGVGVIDIVENRLVGMKSRGVYETPGGTVLFQAHRSLEKLTLDRMTMSFKKIVSENYGQLVYDGLWFTPLREALDQFVDSLSQTVTGKVRVKLYKGNCTVVGASSPYSLYNEEFVTFGADEVYNQKDAEGFINLFALPLKIRAIMNEKNKK
ncbi:argininosuccinate synthase [Serpentinicella alkaliphila]|uniref:Argininosuccinate synthase n=1 Tax=Serpentinicella alkaliphila TaxID=1734049 RepID=A0A4R2TW83_9FIRM|nr:argininosuccinate synthase [Serpentinicella alkaliphila]QUH25527.1 argininosuccinate synthase [Serpentinicella alkaliphila]TCQ01879.1 argininosuccinate synthase [Serpentinicella alkaliphila]